MRTAHVATRVLLIACALQLLLPGCRPSKLPAPVPAAVDPASAKEGARQRLRIAGEHFYLGVTRRIGGEFHIDDVFSARIGGIALEEVARVGEEELLATFPGSIPVGTWDVEVSGPSGTGVLSGAFTVIPREICVGEVDDDGDGAIDCADSECLDLPCDDGNGCTINDACTAAGTCSGGPCVPPSSCWTGGCVAGTCRLSVLVGQGCNDGLSCTASDTCQADGSCVGLNDCKSPPTACHQSTGTCQADSTCSYAVATGSPCDDGAACTAGDTCTASAACVGSTYSCTPPGECFASACDGSGGCLVSPTYGAACTGGVCLGDGSCLPVVWPYQPSNFQPSNGVPPGPNLTIPNGCSMSFNSTNNTWPNSCPGVTRPTGRIVTMAGGGDAMLISVWSLTVEPRASLILLGDKPVIFGAFGDVRIQGTVRVNTSPTNWNGYTGAGANPASCGQMNGASATSSTAGGGGGAFGGSGASGGGTGAGTGGTAGSPSTAPLRGGCRGGNGGGSSGGLGGSGGGAVQFSAGGHLEVSSVITASGSGGKGANGSASAGGGGGGSGGMILLEGNTVVLTSTAVLTSNGGGGGSGEGQGAGNSGADGDTDTADPAPGGIQSSTSGAGGSGAAGAIAATPGTPGTSGGAGGGGAGVGVIIVRANQSASGSCVHQPAVGSPAPVYINCP